MANNSGIRYIIEISQHEDTESVYFCPTCAAVEHEPEGTLDDVRINADEFCCECGTYSCENGCDDCLCDACADELTSEDDE